MTPNPVVSASPINRPRDSKPLSDLLADRGEVTGLCSSCAMLPRPQDNFGTGPIRLATYKVALGTRLSGPFI
jgi:hypothetical protein